MAPGGKRKRGDGNSNDAGSRPSPHRPQNMNLARGNRQQQQSQQNDGRNSRRGSRVGSASTPQSPVTSQTSPTAMSTLTTMPPPKLQVAPPSTPKTPVVQQNTMAGATKVCSANEYLTPARVEAWNGEGRSALVQDGIRAQADGDMFVLALLFDDLVQACIEHSLGAVEAGSVVRDILAASTSDEVDGVSLFLDTVSNWTDAGSTDPSIRVMLEATNIDPARLRAELESSLLISLNLVRSTFPKMAIRKATHALYRQSNYNLLREETEGYSKLITEYFTTVNSQPPNQKVVGDTFERVTALIGAFDLDVGRVLDVTLDVFANLLVKYTRFFVKFLRTSSWWPELKVTHGIEWEEPKVSTLPLWALPESFDWFYTDAGREEQYRRHQERDAEFWKRVEELQGNGMKAYFELGARRITSGLSSLKSKTGEVMDVESSASTHQTEKEDASKKDDLGADFEKIQQWSQDWMAQTHTLPPLGNRIAAQLLGFKLRFYASDARDANDTLPDNLIYLSALLIKIGFISMADLYPHLYPLDEDMDSHMDRLLKEQKEREDKLRGISNNALAMAGALPDDMPPVPASVTRLRESESRLSTKPESQRGTPPPTEETKAKLPEPVDQKVALLRSLLCIGAIPEALFILGRFPKLLEVYPDLYDYLNRLANHSLNKVYEWARPFPQHLVPITPKSNGQSMPHSTDYIPRRTLRWAKLEERDASEGIDYRFYWDDWADNTPVCQNVDDVFSFYKTFLVFVGPGCGRDATVLTKLARIGKKSLAEDPSPENWRRWTALSGRFLVPALSFSGQNPGAVSEVWELIKQFDTRTRYEIYYNWCPRKGKQDLRVKAKNAEIKAETTRLFSRVSTENTREMARLIAKPALACPGIVLREAQNKAEAYVNLGEPLVECCRYLTYLGYDCLNWVFIDSLTENARLKKTMQGDGMVTSMWLQNTALFIAKTYKRYSLMDSTPVLQFVTDKLLQGRKIEYLEILEQLITLMAGIGPVLAVPEAQVFGLSVGPLLRAYTLEHYLGDKRHQAKSTAKRLLKHLRDAELAPQILIALAQELEEYAFREEHERKNANPDEGIEKQDATPLKVIGWKLDNLYSKFTQFLDFLRTYLSVEEFDAMVPGVVELVSEFNLSPSLAFAITRTSLSAKINSSRAIRKNDSDKAKRESLSPSKSEGSIPTPTQANGDVTMGGVEDESMANGTSMTDNPAKKETSPDDAEMKDAGALAEDEVNESTGVEQASTPNGARKSLTTATGRTDPAIEALAHHFKMAMPETYGNHICLEFFVTFWQLSFFDIHTVTTMKNMSEYSAASKHYSTEATKVSLERRDLSTQAVAKRKAEIQGYNDQSDAMRKEAHESYQAALKTQQHLKKEMNQWFEGISMMTQQSKELHMVILQDCFLPRIMASSQDAQFASAMLKFMHEAGVPGFRTSKLLDILFTHPILTNVIFMCTSREAQNLGRFLNDVLKDLNLWHKDEVHYTRNSQGQKKSLPGFAMKYNPAGTPVNFLDHKDFKKLLNKWHSNIFKALETCFKSDEPMHIRNAINVLKAISSSFPKIDTTGKSLNQLVQHLSQHDSRPDIKLAATSLLGDLKKGESTWISAEVFKGEPAPAPTRNPSTVNAASRLSSEQPKTPQPPNAKLNAAAPPFNARPMTLNGVVHREGVDVKHDKDDKKPPATITPVSDIRPRSGEPNRTTQLSSRPLPPAQFQRNEGDGRTRAHQQAMPSISAHLPPTTSKPDVRNGTAQSSPGNRASHALPPRPDAHPPRPRPLDRANERQPDYGRTDRPVDPQRDPFPERLETSPNHRPDRGYGTAERRDLNWPARDPREPREYHDDRTMRPPTRDARPLPPPAYHARDARDNRDVRDRDRDRDSQGGMPSPQPPLEGRGRLHTNPPSTPGDTGSYRRDFPPRPHQSADRADRPPPRSMERPPPNQPSPAVDRPTINPERAALMNEDHNRPEGFRSERDGRDGRRGRDSRPPSPHRIEDRAPPVYQNREAGRDYRDDRISERPVHGISERPVHGISERPMHETPPHTYPPNRRDEPTGAAPTGPRSGRNDAPSSTRAARDMFMSGPPPRPSTHQLQDPNYGRLNQPADEIPSGPRSTNPMTSFTSAVNNNPDPHSNPHSNSHSNRRDSTRFEPVQVLPPPAPLAPPVGPASFQQQNRTGVHPDRLLQIQADTGNNAGGPRGPGRTHQGPASSPLTAHRPPTGPASTIRSQDRNALNTINNVLTQNQSGSDSPSARTAPSPQTQAPQIRGRGATRAGNFETLNTAGLDGSLSHPNTPVFPRDGQQSRPERSEQNSGRSEHRSQDDGRLDSRSNRDGRRSERSGRQRSRSPDRSDKRPDERSARNGPTERSGRNEEQEKSSDRDRSGRDKRGSERDGSRRDRDRDGEQAMRDGRERRDRSTRDDSSRRGGPPATIEPVAHPNEGRGGDHRGRGGHDRREERSDKRRDDGRASKRRADEQTHGDSKRPRRGQL